MSSIGKLMRQASRIQQQMESVQAALASKTVEASSGGGVVKVVARGDQSIASIKINPEAVRPDDVPFLEDLVLTAVNEALKQSRDLASKDMGAITGGMNIPGLM